MYQGLRVVAVTPAGRRRHLEVLRTYLERARPLLDEWRLWVNTKDPLDLEWIEGAASEFIHLEHPDVPLDNVWHVDHIHRFFRNCTDPGTVYIRFDDDVVYVHPDAVLNLVGARLRCLDPFVVYGNIVNNAVCTHHHQRVGAITTELGEVGPHCLDPLGWDSSPFAVHVHNRFFENFAMDRLGDYMFPDVVIQDPERFSINCMAFLGRDFAEFDGVVDREEESFISSGQPRALGKSTMIAGDALVVHYGFYPQRPTLDGTDIMERYESLRYFV